MRRPLLAPFLAALLSAPALAQTGPWTDGELVVLSNQAGAFKLYRVAPETGATAELLTPQYLGGWSGALTFDSYRGGLLANISLPPDGTFAYRLWLIQHDGTAAALPGFTGSLRALCSTGDGRIFFQRHYSMAQGLKPVEYFDAASNLHTLKEADGVTDFQIEVEHLLYHPASNALIGSSSGWWSATDCDPTGGTVYRIPLSSDGLRVVGPVTCVQVAGNTDELMSLDLLPGGDVLVTVSSGAVPSQSRLYSVNALTLGVTPWADPLQGEIEGGVWSARLGRAVLHAGGPSGYELRTFAAGQSDSGGALPTSQPIAGWGGYSPVDDLFEVDLNGPACQGYQIPYGVGLAGKGGHVPLLGIVGCTDIGNPFTLSIHSVVGNAAGFLIVGLAPGSTPFRGGTFLLGSISLIAPVHVGGPAGAAGQGSLALPGVLSNPATAGLDIYLQGAFVDSFAVHGISLSNGLRFKGL